MNHKALLKYWKTDYERYISHGISLTGILFFNPCYKYSFFMRLCKYLRFSRFHKLYFPSFVFFRFVLRHYEVKYNIQIPYETKIGYGLRIAHYGGIVVNGHAVIGNNFSISQGVTVGKTHTGIPTIGNHVYLGAGCKVVGGVSIGNHVKVGANCGVVKDAPDYSTVVGIPGSVISSNGSVIWQHNDSKQPFSYGF